MERAKKGRYPRSPWTTIRTYRSLWWSIWLVTSYKKHILQKVCFYVRLDYYCSVEERGGIVSGWVCFFFHMYVWCM
ncbi:hypothetical protein L873DRAFT_792126 [Choiromyces venosus 120613-1]|uniref:Uncharacterized protein n=1 Tax=Choiromyces venosus 120613-1 TaxID=1336337 RepID=A0A3N4K4E0_9PEZI|nr:hypothetical protein L873DRAFT_792126 [Choiromyces venosus 120613-1]